MAFQTVSPGVFIQVSDNSFIPGAVANAGCCFIGPTLMGPAFIPTVVQSIANFEALFGTLTPDFYTPYAVEQYLQTAQSAVVVRVLGTSGYSPTVNESLYLTMTGTGSNNLIASRSLAIIHPTRQGVTLASGSVTGAPTNFTLVISGADGITTFTSLSVNTTSANYFASVLGTDPRGPYDGYVYVAFPDALNALSGSFVGSGSLQLAVGAANQLNFSGSIFGAYSNAITPIIWSQVIGGKRFSLFQLATFADGNAANQNIKVSIINVLPATIAGQYGTFGIQVRAFDDTDQAPQVLEEFDNLTMDQTSPNYYAVRIGTQYPQIDVSNGSVYMNGEYPNNSQYIYAIQLDASTGESTNTLPSTVLPYGFAPLAPSIYATNVPAPTYITTRYSTPAGSTQAVPNNNTYYGFNFADASAVSYLMGIPSGSTTLVGIDQNGNADAGFGLSQSLAAQDLIDIAPQTAQYLRKFTVPFQGGFNGENPAVQRDTGANITSTNTQGYDLSTSTSPGTVAYNMAITAVSNPEFAPITMLAMPGVLYSQHSYVCTLAINMVQARGDVFYVMDGDVLGGTVQSIVNAVQGLNTSQVAVYHPWMKILDTENTTNIWVPPSVLLPQVFAYNDQVAADFFAPAGLNRGGIGAALAVRTRLAQSDRDTLYQGRVNPIATFPGQGITVWGQKTLLQTSGFDALTRINVARLLIDLRVFVSNTSKYLVFEQNTSATQQRFLNIVNPYLASIQQRQGLYAYQVVMDASNNPPNLVDQNILAGTIFIQPAKAIEFIQLTFNITPTGATFPTG